MITRKALCKANTLVACAGFAALAFAESAKIPQETKERIARDVAALKPMALVVMFDGLRADAVENACAPNLRKLAAGKWQPGYNGAWSYSAQTVPDAPSSSAPNHAAIATGVTTAKNCVTNAGKQFVQCDYRKWPSFLARIADARPDAKTLFMYSWKADAWLNPHPKVEFSWGDALATARHKDVIAAKGRVYARDLANGWELERRLEAADAPDATMLFLDCPDHGGHGLLGGTGIGFYPYGTAYLNTIHTCDAIVGRCLDAIAKRATFKDEDWIIVVTSDHGGYLKTHGLLGGHATTVPLIVAGRHVRNGRIPGTPHNYDVAPTVLSHFGFDVSGMDLDGEIVGNIVAAPDKARPLDDGLAVYMPFDGKSPDNEAGADAAEVTAIVQQQGAVSGAKGGCFGGCLAIAPAEGGAGGVCLKGSESLKFENGADFAMTMWVRMDKPQKGDALILGNKDWKSGGNPGVALSAAKCTENVKVRGVVFNCVTPHGRKRIDVGTYDVEYGKWTFYAVTRGNDGVIRFYQGTSDGRLYCICEDTRDIQLATGLPFYLGQDGTGRYRIAFTGHIDDFALWTRELSHGDVRNVFEAGCGGTGLRELLGEARARKVGGNFGKTDAAGGVSVVTVDPSIVVGEVSPDLWGIFLEDIDLALDGGIYAEMVRNRSFEDGTFDSWDLTLDFWNPVGNAECFLDTSRPLGKRNRHACRVRGKSGAGIANEGYFGVCVKKGHKYNLSLMVRGTTPGPVEVSIEAFSKPVIARAEFTGITDKWQRFDVTLVPNDDDTQARLVLRMKDGGEIFIDCVSMFPADAVCGIFRRDLVDALAALKPSFMRFPGGTFIKGDFIRNAYRWKETVGDVWERRTLRNFWKYWSTNGIGYHEYLLLAEVLKAKPIYCINPGMAINETVPMDKMDKFIEDALDCIEYANGAVDSKWGAMRAAAGHPEPFNMEYLEIGNEHGGKAYEKRYALIAKAVREKYPEVKLIFNYWGARRKDGPNRIENNRDIRDDHLYGSPERFMGPFAHEYDAPKGDFGIFVGEYAVTKTHRYGSLRAAIAEAAFMLGLERNSSQVKLAAYAPLFAHAQHTAWTPNLIYHTNDGFFVNPSWNVQKLFSENRGTQVLKVTVETGSKEVCEGRGKRARLNVIENVQASALRAADGSVVLKLVNCTEEPQQVQVRGVSGNMSKILFTGSGRDAHNTPFEREAVKEHAAPFTLTGCDTLPPLSLVIYRPLTSANASF